MLQLAREIAEVFDRAREALSLYVTGWGLIGFFTGLGIFGIRFPDLFLWMGLAVMALGAALSMLIAWHMRRLSHGLFLIGILGLITFGALYGVFWYLASHPIGPPRFGQ